jgi:hypothetical protein
VTLCQVFDSYVFENQKGGKILPFFTKVWLSPADKNETIDEFCTIDRR